MIAALNAHPGLWCRFATEDDAVYMIPDQEHGDCEIPVTEMTDREFEEYRGRLIRPFRSNETQLFRAEIYLTPTYVHLFMDLSHLIIDGESFDILLDDIDRAYLGEVSDEYPIGNASMKAEALSPEGSGGLYGIFQEVMIKKGRYICSTEYRTNEHSEASIQRMTDALDKMLEHFDPAMKLTDLLNCHP